MSIQNIDIARQQIQLQQQQLLLADAKKAADTAVHEETTAIQPVSQAKSAQLVGTQQPQIITAVDRAYKNLQTTGTSLSPTEVKRQTILQACLTVQEMIANMAEKDALKRQEETEYYQKKDATTYLAEKAEARKLGPAMTYSSISNVTALNEFIKKQSNPKLSENTMELLANYRLATEGKNWSKICTELQNDPQNEPQYVGKSSDQILQQYTAVVEGSIKADYRTYLGRESTLGAQDAEVLSSQFASQMFAEFNKKTSKPELTDSGSSENFQEADKSTIIAGVSPFQLNIQQLSLEQLPV